MSRRIVIINPNSTEAVTQGISAAVDPLRNADGPKIDCVTLEEGPPGIETAEHIPQELARGVDGAMTGFAYPEMLVRVYDLFTAGKVDAAEDLFDAYLPLVRHELQPGLGLAIRKEVLKRRGAIASSKVRAPGPSLSPEDQAELGRLIDRVEARLSTLGLAA